MGTFMDPVAALKSGTTDRNAETTIMWVEDLENSMLTSKVANYQPVITSDFGSSLAIPAMSNSIGNHGYMNNGYAVNHGVVTNISEDDDDDIDDLLRQQEQERLQLVADGKAAAIERQQEQEREHQFAERERQLQQQLLEVQREQEKQREAEQEKHREAMQREQKKKELQEKLEREKIALEKKHAKQLQREKEAREREILWQKEQARRKKQKEEEEAQRKAELEQQEEEARIEKERYKAQRNAAKKERRQEEKKAKAAAEAEAASAANSNAHDETNNGDDSHVRRVTIIAPSVTESVSPPQSNVGDDETKANKRNSKETRQEKKRKKQEQRRIELEQQAADRASYWEPEIEKEVETVAKMVQLCVAEFCRKNKMYERLDLEKNEHIQRVLVPHCRESYRKLFDLELTSRVVTKGMERKQQDMDERTGTIQYWDQSKGKFLVSLEGKKGNAFSVLLCPSNLEAVAVSPNQRKKKNSVTGGHAIKVEDVYENKPLILDLDKKLIHDLVHADSIEVFLMKYLEQQDYVEAMAVEMERERQSEEAEERRRRAEKKRREEKEWEERTREYAARKLAYDEWTRENRRGSGGAHTAGCDCPECRFQNFFGSRSFGGGMPFAGGMGFGGFSFGSHSMSFTFDADGFYMGGDDGYNDWDQRWDKMHEDDLDAANEEAAEILGVDIDSSAADIKRVYHRKCLLYHPDKYHVGNPEGLTKEQCEAKFKELQNAYDHLMSNFDDD
jgi:hypothetical protein